MIRARLVCAGAAALVAAVGFAPAVATGAAATPATASTICVPLVVDARSIGGPVDTECTTVKKGATGIDVLETGGHSVTFRRDGLLCTIDGLPKSGCADVDNTHYWAYYHREPNSSSWDYSNEGASTYQPENNETDGWVYDDGADTVPKPDNIPRSTICAAKATPSPKATPTTTRPTPTRSVEVTPTAHKPTHHRPQIAPTVSITATPATPTATVSGPGQLPSTGASGHGNATGAIVAVAVIAAIAGAAVVTVRRRRP